MIQPPPQSAIRQALRFRFKCTYQKIEELTGATRRAVHMTVDTKACIARQGLPWEKRTVKERRAAIQAARKLLNGRKKK